MIILTWAKSNQAFSFGRRSKPEGGNGKEKDLKIGQSSLFALDFMKMVISI